VFDVSVYGKLSRVMVVAVVVIDPSKVYDQMLPELSVAVPSPEIGFVFVVVVVLTTGCIPLKTASEAEKTSR
jgi:hypothetical protein